MQTYGQKWRAKPAACETTHVPRSAQPLLRLDSTGNVSSFESKNPTSYTPVSTQPTDMNHNSSAMKNWVVNRFQDLSRSSFSGSQKNIGADVNANMFEYMSGNLMNGAVSNMNTRNSKVMQPQCGFAGWYYNGQCQHYFNRPIGLFPCHQFSNSFTNQTPLNCRPDMFYGNGYINGKAMDHHRPKRHKMDRPRQGPVPMHKNLKHENKSSFVAKQENPETRCEKSSHQSNYELDKLNCDKVKLENQAGNKFNKPAEDMGESKMTCRLVEDLRYMGFDIALNQELPDDFSSTLDENINISNCEQAKKSELKHDSNSVTQMKEGCGKVTNDVDNPVPHETEHKVESENNSQDTNIHVLFIRKNRKKGRPSGSKQRRRKMQKSKCSSETPNPKRCESAGGINEGSDDVPEDASSSMSFIVGFNQIQSPNMQTNAPNFTFSFSEDEIEDFSDDSWDSDVNIKHIEAEFSKCDLFNFLPGCNTPSKPINFKVHISPVDIQSNDRNEWLDRLNKAWGIQVSVDDSWKNKNTKKSSKKVHFPEDENLHVTHHMYAWSYAYRSSRSCYWENFARDRDRFKRRIQEVEQVLLPVLESSHHESVYNKLYGAVQS